MENNKKQTIEMLISFFNMKTGTSHKFANERNIKAFEEMLAHCNNDVQAIKKFISDNAEECKKITRLGSHIVATADKFCMETEYVAPEEPKTEETPKATNLETSMAFMSTLINQMLGQVKTNEIQEEVAKAVREDLRLFIAQEYGHIEKKVTLSVGDKKVEIEGVLHKKFNQVLKYINRKQPVFLTGPAGCGKNVLCKQVAEALGLKFYFTNAVTQEYKLTGFTDANGIYQESQFYKAFKNGGLFMLDEMDASIPEVLIILNSAIANRYFDFPAPIGYVEAHPDFRVIAAGNTLGHGADLEYCGRNQLDSASLNRFRTVKVDYDEKIEEACAMGDMDLLGFCRAFRKATKTSGLNIVVSYRNISGISEMLDDVDEDLPLKDLIEGSLTASLDIDDLNSIASQLEGFGKYSEAFKQIIKDRKAY